MTIDWIEARYRSTRGYAAVTAMDDALPEPFLFRLTVHPTPSPNDPGEADEFYKALGMAMVAWGRLEGHFVTTLLTLIAADYPRHGTRLPMQWEKRAEVWKEVFGRTDQPLLLSIRERALSFIAEMAEVATDRNALAHALWEEFNNADDPLSIGAVRIRAKSGTRDGLDIARATVTVEAVKEVAEKASRLNLDLIHISKLITTYRSLRAPPPSDIRVI